MSTGDLARLGREADTAWQYRADIDGLRAVAVLSVIFHHFLVPGFRGGFVGVDVFFVISGFLIAEHIDSDLREGRFSLLGFYERRIRRIFPAFFLMYALTLLAAWLILIPRDRYATAAMSVRVIPFLANLTFYKNVEEYGGEFASHIPLLHTWSLAVEEQFYLFFPLLMLALSRWAGRHRLAVIGLLSLFSFAACLTVVRAVPSAAFFLTPFRAWELLAGAALAVAKLPPPRAPQARAVLAAFGLLLIVAADVSFSYAIPHPSELTLLPCAGAVAIIHACASPTTLAGRVLGNPVMRRVGWWSYSLYLYHWPLLVFAQYYFFDPLSVAMRALLIAATFLLGWLSWRYIEQPFRRSHAVLARPAVYGLAAVTGAALILATVAIRHITDPRRDSLQQRMLSGRETTFQSRCKNTSPVNPEKPECKLGDAAAPADTVLWGDSHALSLLPAFDAAYARHHEAAIFAERSTCPALLDVHISITFPGASDLVRSWLGSPESDWNAQCYQETAATLNWIVQHHIHTVILAGHWAGYLEGRLEVRLTDPQSPHNDSLLDNAKVFSRGLEKVLAVLDRQRVRVFVMDDAPENRLDVPYAIASARRLGLRRDLGISRAEYEVQQRSAAEIFADLQRRYGFRILKPQDYLCANGRCAISRNDLPLYSDHDHLSPLGAEVAEPALDAIWSNPEFAQYGYPSSGS